MRVILCGLGCVLFASHSFAQANPENPESLSTPPPNVAPALEAEAVPEAVATPARVNDTPVEQTQRPHQFMVNLEFRPIPWVGVGLRHRAGTRWTLEHSLSFAFNAFPHFELRTIATPDRTGPFGGWAAYSLRRIQLTGLPPIEQYIALGVAATAMGKKVSAAAGLGVRFQLPPLSDEAAADFGTFLSENVSIVFFFSVRLHPW